jgi:hypothetical protein
LFWNDAFFVVVQSLNSPRQAFPKLHVVYFITAESVDLVLEDFAKPLQEVAKGSEVATSGGKSSTMQLYKYHAVHLYFNSGLNSTIIDKLKACEPLRRRIITIVDANLDFVGLSFVLILNFTVVDEIYTAHFDNPKFLSNLSKGDGGVNSDFLRFVVQLASVLVTIDSEPVVRYQKAFDRTKMFASLFNAFIRGYKGRADWKVFLFVNKSRCY